MTVASFDINLQRKLNVICHVGKAELATSAHSMADVLNTSLLVYSPCKNFTVIAPRFWPPRFPHLAAIGLESRWNRAAICHEVKVK